MLIYVQNQNKRKNILKQNDEKNERKKFTKMKMKKKKRIQDIIDIMPFFFSHKKVKNDIYI